MQFNISFRPDLTKVRYHSRTLGRTRMAHTVLVSIPQSGLLRQVRDFLDEAGNRVLEAATEDAALRILDESSSELDLVLIDTHGQNAPSLARQAIRLRPDLKVLMISGEPEYIIRALVSEAGVGFLERPFAWRELKHKIDELMGMEALCGSATLDASSLA